MATLLFSAVGTALGGPLGGAIGALAGRQLDRALFGPGPRDGPRLRELDVSLSSYGVAIPRLHGRMRMAGAIIWATELQEHSELRGSGKGQPALTAYSYIANLAVALSSRPITGIGRIWADGKLLRGAAGDLKTGGTLRIHPGSEDQPVDPLIAANEGEARCPAFRGLAYVVFEALDLTEFGNRIPALTFEVLAGDRVRLAEIVGEALPDTRVTSEMAALAGFAVEDSVAASLAALTPVAPIGLDAAGETIIVHLAGDPSDAILLADPAVSVEDDAFGAAQGTGRRRAPPEPQPPPVLRYHDVDRDYQPGTQHATGRPGPGQPDQIELPAALDAATARSLVEQLALRRDQARERIAWRTSTLEGRIAPGTLVRLPQRSGIWRVEGWEWREAGVELELARVGATPAAASAAPASAPFAPPLDLLPAATRLVAVELPWDGAGGAPDRPRLAAAVGADGANWSGAALYVDRGDGQLSPLGAAPRTRAIVGITLDALGAANPLLIDRGGVLTLALAASDLALTGASLADLAAGANLAVVGEELIQFAQAESLGPGRWRLSGFLRGLGGTEAAIAGHAPRERFALLDARTTTIDSGPIETTTGAQIVALGRGDAEPATSPLLLAGVGWRPLAPVHPRTVALPGGGLRLSWTRRARGGWSWRDGVDVPLAEESERYLVTYEHSGTTLRAWTVATATLGLTTDDLTALAALAPGGALLVRQQGTHAVSLPLVLMLPA